MRWLKEPWLHFLLIGVVLFTLNAMFSHRGSQKTNQQITVSEGEIQWLVRNWQARWQRPPTETELRGLVQDFIRREVLYREALAMGLDRDDEVIRGRMVQKLEFLSEDLAAQAQPSETELQSFFEENLEDYRIPARRSFTHIFFNAEQRGGTGAALAAEQTLAQLRGPNGLAANYTDLGDRFLLPQEYEAQSAGEVARQFGQPFATALFEVEPHSWHGPLPSAYGLHLVRVTETWEDDLPDFALVRSEVLRDYTTELRDQTREAMFTSLATQYEITVDEEAILAASLRGKAGVDSLGGKP